MNKDTLLEEANRAKEQLGFAERLNVQGRFSIADLFPKSKERCGVYLLEFSDGLSYIGQAQDVVRRFAGHRTKHDNICCLRFLPVKQKDLDTVEQHLIHRAEALGIPLTNKVHVSQVQGETDLDSLIPPEEQDAWLRRVLPFTEDTKRVKIDLEEKYRIRHNYQFQRFKEVPHFAEVVAALKLYISESIMAPRRTEFSFWSVSCMPSTNINTWPRLTTVNLNRMEVFVIGYCKQEPEHIWSFVNVAKNHFFEGYTEDEFRAKYPNTGIQFPRYVAAGYDQMRIQIDGIDQLSDVLRDNVVLEAARILNLRLMQKGGNVYASSHCFELADLLL